MAEATNPITTASNPRVGPLERVRHMKRGTEYEVLGEAELQVASVDMLNRPLRLSEGARLTVYRGSDGKLWARETDEFRDGRFETITSAPSPGAGTGGDLGELERHDIGYALELAERALDCEQSGCRSFRVPHDGSTGPEVLARVQALLIRSGKLVASIGSGEETKGATPMGSGHSRAEPFGLGPKDECPSRDPSAPGVLWSAWSETDADSDPSDPGVTYCTEWFVGRWPTGAEEPDCRILIGTSRSAEIIARRVAEKLTSILNTDRIRLGSSGWRADCFRTRMSEFDAAYKKASESSQPQDWMTAALLAQQFRNVAYAVLIGEAPRQEPPASAGWVLVPRELPDAMVQAGGSVLPPTHRLTDCYDYFRDAWAAALDARPIPPGAPCDGSAEGGETGTGSTEGNSAVREAEAPR